MPASPHPPDLAELGAVSPELALVDPELAAALRALSALEPSSSHAPGPPAGRPHRAMGYDSNGANLRGPRGAERPQHWLAVTCAPGAPVQRSSRSGARRRRTAALRAVIALVTVGLLLGIDLPTDTAAAPGEAARLVSAGPARSASLLLPPSSATGTLPATSTQTPAPTAELETESGVPRAPAPTGEAEPRRLAWAPVARAIGYRVELFRGSERVFRRVVPAAVLALPASWQYRGRRVSLRPGVYRWVVWPVFRTGPAPVATVQATLNIR